MQCKDIDERPLLEHLEGRLLPQPQYKDPQLRAKWTTHWQTAKPDDSGWSLPFPPDTPDKLRLAKMQSLLKRGLVDGCGCGCRGDWCITDKGLERLRALRSPG